MALPRQRRARRPLRPHPVAVRVADPVGRRRSRRGRGADGPAVLGRQLRRRSWAGGASSWSASTARPRPSTRSCPTASPSAAARPSPPSSGWASSSAPPSGRSSEPCSSPTRPAGSRSSACCPSCWPWPRSSSRPTTRARRTTPSYRRSARVDLKGMFALPRQAPDFYWALSGRLALVLGYFMVNGYQLYILTDYVGLDDERAARVLGINALLFLATAILGTLVAGPALGPAPAPQGLRHRGLPAVAWSPCPFPLFSATTGGDVRLRRRRRGRVRRLLQRRLRPDERGAAQRGRPRPRPRQSSTRPTPAARPWRPRPARCSSPSGSASAPSSSAPSSSAPSAPRSSSRSGPCDEHRPTPSRTVLPVPPAHESSRP